MKMSIQENYYFRVNYLNHEIYTQTEKSGIQVIVIHITPKTT